MDVNKWLKQVETWKGADLSRDEDLAIAVMNLISLEEHFFFTHQKTRDGKYLELLKAVREMRKKLLGKLVKNPKGEEWCISKHLLAGSMRLIEVGTKELGQGREKEAKEYFHYAFELFSLFFAINLKAVGVEELKNGGEQQTENDVDVKGPAAEVGERDVDGITEDGGVLGTFSKMVKKIVDCCKE